MNDNQNIAAFNTIVGLVFAQLYESFPQTIEIDGGAIADALGVEKTQVGSTFGTHYNFGNLPNGKNLAGFLAETLLWLRDEGFVRSPEPHNGWVSACVLTRGALAMMNKVPAGVEPGKTLGSQISDAAKGAGKAAGNVALGDLVGQVIGGITKSFIG